MIIKTLDNLRLYPVTIIGSGPASLTLALELEEKKIPCLILEAGSFERTEDSQDFYKGYSGGENSYLQPLHLRRSRMFGGTSYLWSGLSRPLDEYDFKEWPIKKNDIDPYFKKAAKILELKSDFKNDILLNENIKQVEYEYSNQESALAKKKKFFESEPVRFATKYNQRIKKSKYIHLSLNSPVTQIIGTDSVVTHVMVKTNHAIKKINVKNLIVGCGGYENARLLLWSQETSKNAFLKNVVIGTHFNAHPNWPLGRGIARIKDLDNHFQNKLKNPIHGGTYILSPTKRFIEQRNIKNISIRVLKSEHHIKYKELLRELMCVAPNYGKKIAEMANKKIFCGHVMFACVSEQEPLETNKVTLSKNDFDKFGIPRIHMQFELQDSVRKTMSTFLEEIGKYFITHELGRISIEDWLYDYNKKFSIHGIADNGCHHIGSTRMGENIKNSVVDKNLLVHNTKNLYVVGSSTFTTGGAVNPTLSICQLSLKLADYLERNIEI